MIAAFLALFGPETSADERSAAEGAPGVLIELMEPMRPQNPLCVTASLLPAPRLHPLRRLDAEHVQQNPKHTERQVDESQP